MADQDLDPLALFEARFLPKRFRKRLEKKRRLGPQVDAAREHRRALLRAEEISRRRIGAVGFNDLRTGAGSMGPPPVGRLSTPGI